MIIWNNNYIFNALRYWTVIKDFSVNKILLDLFSHTACFTFHTSFGHVIVNLHWRLLQKQANCEILYFFKRKRRSCSVCDLCPTSAVWPKWPEPRDKVKKRPHFYFAHQKNWLLNQTLMDWLPHLLLPFQSLFSFCYCAAADARITVWNRHRVAAEPAWSDILRRAQRSQRCDVTGIKIQAWLSLIQSLWLHT